MKVALVTGGSRGIGAETVKLLAKNGYTVILNYNQSEALAKSLCAQLVANGADVHLYRADISNIQDVSQMFAWIGKYFKHLDVLVNNAGVALGKMCQDTTPADYDRVMDTNAKGTFFCCKYAVDLMKNGGGAIVNVSSIWGTQGASCESVYAMSKHAVVGLTKSLAEELSSLNITVNCVCPPIVSTDMCAHYTQKEIQQFCEENNVSVYTPQRVAQDIVDLALSNKTAQILQEK